MCAPQDSRSQGGQGFEYMFIIMAKMLSVFLCLDAVNQILVNSYFIFFPADFHAGSLRFFHSNHRFLDS